MIIILNVVIKPANELNNENSLKEVNIVIKYYKKKENNTDYICNPDFNLEKISNTDKTIYYKLIINNKCENNSSNNLNYICYLRLIKKNNILNNEELNTIAQITSKSLYIDKFNIIEPDKEFYFNLNNLKNNEDYIASIIIKIENVNVNEEGEKYYSLTYHTNQVEKDKILIIIISIIILAFIIAFILFLIICHKMKIKNKNNNLQDKVNAIDFSNGINEELINNKELKK